MLTCSSKTAGYSFHNDIHQLSNYMSLILDRFPVSYILRFQLTIWYFPIGHTFLFAGLDHFPHSTHHKSCHWFSLLDIVESFQCNEIHTVCILNCTLYSSKLYPHWPPYTQLFNLKETGLIRRAEMTWRPGAGSEISPKQHFCFFINYIKRSSES
jgi:hypothetical protein